MATMLSTKRLSPFRRSSAYQNSGLPVPQIKRLVSGSKEPLRQMAAPPIFCGSGTFSQVSEPGAPAAGAECQVQTCWPVSAS